MKDNSIRSTQNKRHDYSKLFSVENQINFEEIDQTRFDLYLDASPEYNEIGMIRRSSDSDHRLHKTTKSVRSADKNQIDLDMDARSSEYYEIGMIRDQATRISSYIKQLNLSTLLINIKTATTKARVSSKERNSLTNKSTVIILFRS